MKGLGGENPVFFHLEALLAPGIQAHMAPVGACNSGLGILQRMPMKAGVMVEQAMNAAMTLVLLSLSTATANGGPCNTCS